MHLLKPPHMCGRNYYLQNGQSSRTELISGASHVLKHEP